MGKKIIIGSLLVLTLLLLMPSIPAIQQITIEEGIRQNIEDKLDTINLNELEAKIKDFDIENSYELENEKSKQYTPIFLLTFLVFYMMQLELRGELLWMFSQWSDILGNTHTLPLMRLRGAMLLIRWDITAWFLNNLVELMNWDMYRVYDVVDLIFTLLYLLNRFHIFILELLGYY